MTRRPTHFLAFVSLIAVAIIAAFSTAAAAQEYLWQGYAENPQHTTLSAVASQPLSAIRWTTNENLDPQYSGDELLIHYGSPMLTAGNLAVIPVKTTASGGFELQGLVGSTGAAAWTLTSDYVVPPVGSWFPPYSPTLTNGGLIYYAGAGGSIYRSNTGSAGAVAPTRLNFYGGSITAPPDSHIYIDTPITADAAGDIYFGYMVSGTPSSSLGAATIAALGSGGIARISASGVATFVSASAASGDSTMQKAVENCAPAVTPDGSSVYIAINSGTNGNGYLLKLDSATLATEGKVAAKDPQTGGNGVFHDSGTASPTIGPDGDVYMGVFDTSGTSRGWLEHYSADLATTKTPGGFGWDNTASIVPASMVPSYHGASSYLLMTKYNNYIESGGGGQNMIAILDPNAATVDNQRNNPTGATIMQTVLTKLGPTPYPDGGVYEWCDNNAVVDPATGSILITSEDGHLYRWNLATNTLTQSITLGGGLGEAYTPTLIGPDGTVFAINNGLLHAVGLPLVTWTGASGTAWNATASNWSSGSPPAAATYSNGAVLQFGDTDPLSGQTVPNTSGQATISIQAAGVQPGWITFTNTGAAAGGVDYLLGGGPIGGAGGITLAGTGGAGGRVTLTSANSFSGGVSILAGQLNLQNAAALGNSSGVTVSYAAGLELQSSGGEPIVYGLTAAGAAPISLSLAGPGVAGGGALTSIAGNNTYAGPIAVGVGSGGATIVSASSAAGDGLTLSGGVAVSPGTTLTIAGAGPTSISTAPLSLAATTFDGPSELAVAGTGTVEITSPPALGAGSKLSVTSGKLRFDVASGAPSVGTGVTATIEAGATLELAGTVSALSSSAARVNIVNDNTTAGILVTGKNQEVGAIAGAGSLTIAAGAALTADHIVQSALVIGGTAAEPGVLTIAASDNAADPIDGALANLPDHVSRNSSVDLDSTLTADEVSLTPLAPNASAPDAGSNGRDGTALPEPSTLLAGLIAIGAIVLAASFARRLDYRNPAA